RNHSETPQRPPQTIISPSHLSRGCKGITITILTADWSRTILPHPASPARLGMVMLDTSRFSLLCLAAALLVAPATAGEKAVSVTSPLFEAQVRPLFRIYCFDCHGEGEKLRGNLDLRLRRLVVKGGDSGPAVVTGKPDQSLLLQRVRAGEMPPGKRKKLSKAEIELIGRWIAGGAKVERAEPETIAAGMHLTPEDRTYWAYQPIRR